MRNKINQGRKIRYRSEINDYCLKQGQGLKVSARHLRGGGGTPGNYWWGCAAWFSNPDPITDQTMSFFHTRFQTWPLRNYFIIT